MKLWDVAPHPELTCDRAPNAAYLAAQPGDQYVLFLTEGGPVGLDLKAAPGTSAGKWVNVETGEWSRAIRLQGGAVVSLEAPGTGPWVAAFVRGPTTLRNAVRILHQPSSRLWCVFA